MDGHVTHGQTDKPSQLNGYTAMWMYGSANKSNRDKARALLRHNLNDGRETARSDSSDTGSEKSTYQIVNEENVCFSDMVDTTVLS